MRVLLDNGHLVGKILQQQQRSIFICTCTCVFLFDFVLVFVVVFIFDGGNLKNRLQDLLHDGRGGAMSSSGPYSSPAAVVHMGSAETWE